MTAKNKIERAFDYYPRLAKVRDYVSENLDERITLKSAARIASLEPRYFARFFRAKTGVTFTEWLHDLRIERAKTLLAHKDLTVGSVAGRLGYESERTFLRAFKKRTGTTPSAYKRKERP